MAYIEVNISKLKLKVGDCEEQFMMVVVNPISNMIQNQQRISDEMYQEAIEANYSHEQMTPLNSILGNSSVVKEMLRLQIKQLLKMDSELRPGSHIAKVVDGLQSNVKLLKAIRQSGNIMWMYNLNQIRRMQIRKNQFVSESSAV